MPAGSFAAISGHLEPFSFIESANRPDTDFPLQNLPFGVFLSGALPVIGVAIGDQILDLRRCAQSGLLDSLAPDTAQACLAPCLNPLMALGKDRWSPLRQRIGELLRAASPHRSAVKPLLVPMDQVAMAVPARIGDYTDFYASIHHATNVGRMFRPDNLAVAELQVRAHRLSRPRFLDSS